MVQGPKRPLKRVWGDQLGLFIEDREARTRGKDLAVPDQSYQIKDLVEKMTSGVNLGQERAAIFGDGTATLDDVDLSKVGDMDLVDRQELHSNLKEQEASARATLRKQEAERKARVVGDQDRSGQKFERSKSSKYDDSKSSKVPKERRAPDRDDVANDRDDQVRPRRTRYEDDDRRPREDR